MARLPDEEVEIPVGPVRLAGSLTVPEQPIGLVVLVHGGGSGRRGPRDRYVARVLQQGRLATLLVDLLPPDGGADRADVLAVDLLAGRLAAVLAWVRDRPGCRGLPLGLFGTGTGTAAALRVAAAPEADVAAVVSRGGRPDLAGAHLERVQVPTLLLVGGRNDVVLQRNEAAARRLGGEHRVVRVSGATHLFEEPGTLELAAGLARDWFVAHLSRAAQPTA
jgi:putative phosphoribosyl transferase